MVHYPFFQDAAPVAKTADSDGDALTELEPELAARRAPLPAHVVHEVVRGEGEHELDRTVTALLWSGLSAGLSMGFSFLAEAELQAALPDAPWRHLVAAFGYTVGFVIVVLGRQQLFTESTITAVLPVLTHRDLPTLGKLVRLWGLVLATNIIGTWVFAALLAFGKPFHPEVAQALSDLAAQTTAQSFVKTATMGMLSGWLIALMVWLLPSAGSARFWVVIFITYVVAFSGLPHIIAGSGEAAYAVLTGASTPTRYLLSFFAPTLLGNSLGGVILAALVNHAPVADRVRQDGGND
jgi:formate/nitrite transporter FocA (FNT family)